jgi:cysteine desulfurase
MSKPIYLDAHSTTPVDDRVLAAMLPFFTEQFGNPGSVGHVYGWNAESAVKQARESIASAIGADPTEIIFTSGATEANNLAIKGIAEAHHHRGKHIITLATEHHAVLDPCNYLASLGFAITVLPVQPDGLVDLAQFMAALRSDTILVSVMAANNEIGVLQPIAAIGQLCHDRGIFFHSDAAQAIGKIPLDMATMAIDLMSLTAHKIYGPKGIGALYVRRKDPRVTIAPQLHGGGQERDRRSGTLNPPLIVGMAQAISLATEQMTIEQARILTLRDRLWQKLQAVEGILLNGHPTQRLAGNLNVSVPGVDGNALLLGLRSVMAVSSGSACSTAKIAPSHVLQALGRSEDLAYASVRFGLGRSTTSIEVDRAAAAFCTTVTELRQARDI